jgi:glycosyltransferase involved in cell wall biosynthesis
MPAVIAYLSNQFPSPVEPYVVDEIRELRKRGVAVIPCSARAADRDLLNEQMRRSVAETLYFWPLRLSLVLRSVWICLNNLPLLSNLMRRILLQGSEPFSRRLRALAHTGLGAYYAVMLDGRGVQHIHVHHGYFSSWIAMVAARLLGIDFSVTLHGSDLLLHAAYLDEKLRNCKFCLTISEYNRRHILQNYPDTRPDKAIVQRLGVDPPPLGAIRPKRGKTKPFVMLSVAASISSA